MAALLLACAGCWKKSGLAVVTAKDYVPAREISETPNESPSDSPVEEEARLAEPVPSPSEESANTDDDEGEEKAINDIIGPPLDPRATDHEQWIVSVRMIESGRQIDVRTDQSQWEKLKINDRVHVRYREGKYTHTVWSAEID